MRQTQTCPWRQRDDKSSLRSGGLRQLQIGRVGLAIFLYSTQSLSDTHTEASFCMTSHIRYLVADHSLDPRLPPATIAHLSVLYRRTSRMPIRWTSVVQNREGPSSLVSHSWLTNSCQSDRSQVGFSVCTTHPGSMSRAASRQS